MINEFHIKFGHRLPRNTEFPKKKKKKKKLGIGYP